MTTREKKTKKSISKFQIPLSRFDFNNAHARWLRGLALHHHFGRREEAKMECERAVECARMQGGGCDSGEPPESTLGCSVDCTEVTKGSKWIFV